MSCQRDCTPVGLDGGGDGDVVVDERFPPRPRHRDTIFTESDDPSRSRPRPSPSEPARTLSKLIRRHRDHPALPYSRPTSTDTHRDNPSPSRSYIRSDPVNRTSPALPALIPSTHPLRIKLSQPSMLRHSRAQLRSRRRPLSPHAAQGPKST